MLTERSDLSLVVFFFFIENRFFFLKQYILIAASAPPTLPQIGFLIRTLTHSSTYKYYYVFLLSYNTIRKEETCNLKVTQGGDVVEVNTDKC